MHTCPYSSPCATHTVSHVLAVGCVVQFTWWQAKGCVRRQSAVTTDHTRLASHCLMEGQCLREGEWRAKEGGRGREREHWTILTPQCANSLFL